MNKQRLEAFSDGVFAIVITLLILDVRIPDVPPAGLGAALVHMMPQVFSYVLSFFVVGLYWLAHHRVAHQVRLINGTFVWLNLLWLLFVSVMPVPTSLLGRYPLQGLPIAIYGADLILANITGFFITLYMKSHPELCVAPVSSSAVRSLVPVYAFTNGVYLVGIALGWILPWISYALFAAMLVWLMIRYGRIDNPFQSKGRKTALPSPRR
jgi:uncharacterized membrane protein